jgi:nitroreductase
MRRIVKVRRIVFFETTAGMDVIEALRSRRSIGKLEGDVGEPEIRELLGLAVLAPNHRLTEPWRFTVLRGAARERLGAMWGDIATRDLALEPEAREAAMQRETGKLLRAPVLIAASVRTDPDAVTAAEDFAATAAAVENILLGAAGLGLGAMWRTGNAAYHPEVKAFLGLEPSDRIVAFVYLGRAAGEPPVPKPRNAEAAIRWLD